MTRIYRVLGWAALSAVLLAGNAWAQEVAQRQVEVYGQKIHYLEAGSGPVVILLHGLGGDKSNWAATLPALATRFKVYVPDQIGFGQSDKPLINYRVATLVDFLDGFYKKLGINKASLVGNSLGGWTAAAFALAHPDKVERLVLVDAAGFSFPSTANPRLLNALNVSTRADAKRIAELIFYDKQLYASEAAIETIFTRRMAAGDGYTIQRFIDSIVHGEDVLDNKLSAIKAPTLIIWGREDALTPLELGERFKKEIAGSELFIIDRCGHVPQLECAPAFNAALLKFLSSSMTASQEK